MMKRYDPRGAEFLRMGRFSKDEKACELWWSGSGIRMLLDCTRLEIEAEVADGEHTPWLAVTVDGAPVARLPLAPGVRRYDLLGRMERGALHEIAILRDTQPTDADAAPLKLLAVYTDGVPVAPAPRPHLVEFLGDSLTVGEGTVGPTDAMEWRMIWISNQFAFPTLVSERLNAEKRMIALGGWGAYLSYDGDPKHAIGAIYDRLCAIVPGGEAAYDFSDQREANAVVINLGTNDVSGLGLLPPERRAAGEAALEESAVRLMELVRMRNPRATILWAYGLCGNEVEAPLRRAVERRRAAGDGNVRYLALDDCDGVMGSRSHPGRAAHARAAEQIVEALNSTSRRHT